MTRPGAPLAIQLTLYCLDRDRIEPDDLERAAAKPGLFAALSARRRRATVLALHSDGRPAGLRLDLGGATVTARVMPESERESHLRQFATFLAQRSDLQDPSVQGRVEAVRCVLGLVFEPVGDDPGLIEAFVTKLAQRAGALVFRPDATLADAEGTVLASPRRAPGEAAEALADEGDEDVDQDWDPPTLDQVARRALVGTWLSWRAFLESAKWAEAGEAVAKGRPWLDRQGLLGELEPDERRLADAPLGAWKRQDAIDWSWAVEGMAVLAWALGLAELPAHDTQVDPQALAEKLGLLADEPAALRVERLAPPEALEWQRKRLLAIHWRFVEHRIGAGPTDMRKFESGNWWLTGVDLAAIPLVGDDLAIQGVAITAAEVPMVRAAESVARERHRAINWLCGDHPLWSEVDTST